MRRIASVFVAGLLGGFGASAAGAAVIPYEPAATVSTGFAWSGLGPIDSIDGFGGGAVWEVDAPPGAGYRTVGGFVASSPGLSDWTVLLNGVPLSPYENGSAGAGSVEYRYFYAGPVVLVPGRNVFAAVITHDGSGGLGGTGAMYFVNDDTPVPIPLPLTLALLLSAFALAGATRAGRPNGR